MRVIELMQNDKKDSKWIVDNYRKSLIFVDDSFQRRYVWLEKHKTQLIETILLGYAIPEIYLWQTDTDPITGETKYSIVDGQQRIGALFDYIDEKFKLKATDLTNKDADYSNKGFSELDDNSKTLIWKYQFSIRQIPQSVSQDEIVKMFLRLNSTDKSLNPQELRNAEFNGEFLQLAQEISKLTFWEKNKVFTVQDIRRMKDIEFISSLLIFLRKGIESEINQKAINNMYDLYNLEYREKTQDKEITEKILNEIQRIIDLNTNSIKFISKTTHLYTVYTLIYIVISQNNTLEQNQIESINDFIDAYLLNSHDRLVESFKNFSQDATKSKQSRMMRLKLLREYTNI